MSGVTVITLIRGLVAGRGCSTIDRVEEGVTDDMRLLPDGGMLGSTVQFIGDGVSGLIGIVCADDVIVLLAKCNDGECIV
jgi:hypothetical protein